MDPASPVRNAVFLRRIDPAKNMARFYSLMIERDIFGRIVLVRHYGRIGTHGHERLDEHEDESAAGRALEALARSKVRRGYQQL